MIYSKRLKMRNEYLENAWYFAKALAAFFVMLAFAVLILAFGQAAEAQTVTKQISWNKDTTAQPAVTKYTVYNNSAKVADVSATLNTANVVLSTVSANSIQVSATNDIGEGSKSDPLIAAVPAKVSSLKFEN
jgi:hypothetical protein